MKKLLFVLMLISPIVAAEEQPPFEVKDPAISENFRNLYYAVDNLGITRNSSGLYCIDDPTFCVNPVTHRIGMGTITPSAEVDVIGTVEVNVTGSGDALDLNGSSAGNINIRMAPVGASANAARIRAELDGTKTNLSFLTGGVVVSSWSIRGEVTQPLQPSFLATAPVNTADTTGDGTTFTVEYDVEIYDQGSNYNSGTYTFTAPVSGRYQFQAGILMQGITSAMTGTANFILVTSNRSYVFGYAANTYAYLGSQTLGQWGGSVIADMDASDTAFITIRIAGGTKVADVFDDSSYSYFSGTLIN